MRQNPNHHKTRMHNIRRRNWAIFLAVIFLAVLFFVMTIIRVQIQ